MRVVIQMIIGALIGFLGAYGLLGFDFENFLLPLSVELIVILYAITVLLVVYGIVTIMKMKKKAKLTLSGDEEDAREAWLYQKFSDVSLGNLVSMVTAILGFSVTIVTDKQLIFTNIGFILITMTVIISFFVQMALAKLIYPDRNLPSPADKDYTKKLLLVSDEGERHVMLEGLYHSFSTTNFLLMIAIFVLTFYSYGTGESQLISVFIIGIILIASNTQYFMKIRNR